MYSEKQQKWINHLGTMMIIFLILSLFVYFLGETDNTLLIVLNIINILNFILFQFIGENKLLSSIISIIIGLISTIFMGGFIPGILLMIYGLTVFKLLLQE